MARDIDYMGSSDDLVLILLQSPIFYLKQVVDYNGRLSDTIKRILFTKKVKYINASKKEDINGITFESEVVLIHKFGYILPKSLMEQRRVFNMHSGDLTTNRGAHPVVWSILLQEKETCLSLYELGEQIDLGTVIDTYKVAIDPWDDTITLDQKLNGGFDFLLMRLDQYLKGDITGVLYKNGVYRKKVTTSDFTIDLLKDSYDDMRAKVNSQAAYHSALINISGETLRVKAVKKLVDNYLPEDNMVIVRRIYGVEDVVIMLDIDKNNKDV